MYLCHSNNHFTGLWCREGLVRHFNNGDVSGCSISFRQQLAQSGTTTFFRMVGKHAHDPYKLCNLEGGSSNAYKRPAAKPQTPQFTCPLTRCVIPGCGGSLVEKQHIEANCYGMAGPQHVIHMPKQCSSRNCRSTYAYKLSVGRWAESQCSRCRGLHR